LGKVPYRDARIGCEPLGDGDLPGTGDGSFQIGKKGRNVGGEHRFLVVYRTTISRLTRLVAVVDAMRTDSSISTQILEA
jgi:hypothetical protein